VPTHVDQLTGHRIGPGVRGPTHGWVVTLPIGALLLATLVVLGRLLQHITPRAGSRPGAGLMTAAGSDSRSSWT
jgi:hypothetical protein